MTWLWLHTKATLMAAMAEWNRTNGKYDHARELSREAAELEKGALIAVARSKKRTLSITAVSAVALYFKAGAYSEAEHLANQCLADEGILVSARNEIREILADIQKQQEVET